MICPTCNGTKTVPQSKRKRHLTKPCPACGGFGTIPDPSQTQVEQAKAEIAAGNFVTADEVFPSIAPPSGPLAPTPEGATVVVDMAAILRALGGWATPRE